MTLCRVGLGTTWGLYQTKTYQGLDSDTTMCRFFIADGITILIIILTEQS